MKRQESDEWASVRKAIEDLLHEKRRSAREVSLALGRTHNYIHNIIHRTKYRITKQAIREIIDEMGVSQQEFDQRIQKDSSSIPLVGMIPTGHPQWLTDGAPTEQWIPCFSHESHVGMFALTVTGASMEPVYKPGDTLVLRRLNISVGPGGKIPGMSTELEEIDGKDVVCVRNGEASLKRLRFRWSDGAPTVEFVPVNSIEHTPVPVGPNDKLVIQGVITRRCVK